VPLFVLGWNRVFGISRLLSCGAKAWFEVLTKITGAFLPSMFMYCCISRIGGGFLKSRCIRSEWKPKSPLYMKGKEAPTILSSFMCRLNVSMSTGLP